MSENNKNTEHEGVKKLLKEQNLEKVNGGIVVTDLRCNCGGLIHLGPTYQGGPDVYYCSVCYHVFEY